MTITLTQDGRQVAVPEAYQLSLTPAEFTSLRIRAMEDFGFEYGTLMGSECPQAGVLHPCGACWEYHAGCCGFCCSTCRDDKKDEVLACRPYRVS